MRHDTPKTVRRTLARATKLGVLLSISLFSGCIGCLGPSEPIGECTGSVGVTDVTGPIDPEETYFALLVQETCADEDLHQFDMSFADGQLQILALTDAWSVLQTPKTRHELRPDRRDSSPDMVHEWRIHAPTDRPAMVAGTIGATRGPGGEVQGDFDMEFDDGSSVACDFEIPFEKKRKEGKRPDCGSEGGGGIGGGDFDD